MTITSTPENQQFGEAEFVIAAVDLYRDIHKGIRAELFAITSMAGSIDPSNTLDRAALTDHIIAVGAVLESHAHHEDSFLDPVIQIHLPQVAEQIVSDHERLERSFGRVIDLAETTADASARDQRRVWQLLHLDLASFTSSYLAHQDLEERIVMPQLDSILGPAHCGALHGAIVASIPPDEMVRSLTFMLPAMNVCDQAELLEGVRMAAPPEMFDQVLGLAQSVLGRARFATLAAHLGVGSS